MEAYLLEHSIIGSARPEIWSARQIQMLVATKRSEVANRLPPREGVAQDVDCRSYQRHRQQQRHRQVEQADRCRSASI
jgi:hypothetical protein